MTRAKPMPQLDYMNAYTQEFRLDAARAILLVIDMQYASGSRALGLGRRLTLENRVEFGRERFDNIESMVPNLQRLLGFFRANMLPVLYVVIGSEHPDFLDVPEHMRALVKATNNRVGAREHEILDEVKPKPGELIIRKTTVSAFSSTGIEASLRAMGRDHLVFTGISTNMCVDSTARDAADRGFKCILVEDCCAAAKRTYHDAALLTFQRLFGKVASAEEVSGWLNPSSLWEENGKHSPNLA
jgi:biuret amidohydrolase